MLTALLTAASRLCTAQAIELSCAISRTIATDESVIETLLARLAVIDPDTSARASTKL